MMRFATIASRHKDFARFWDNEVFRETKAVLERILQALEEYGHPGSEESPPP
jgi:very-short-patch-repair endonuclease